jgi:hypothetical protein
MGMGRAGGEMVPEPMLPGLLLLPSRSISWASASSCISTFRLVAVSHDGMAGRLSSCTLPSNVAVCENAPAPAYTGGGWDAYWLL